MMELIRQYCIRKLAQILYECVECSSRDRAEIDWKMAEDFIDNGSFVENILHSPAVVLLQQHGEELTYQEFERFYGRYIWERCFQVLKRDLPYPPYGRINFE